jgi:hypothetical protein
MLSPILALVFVECAWFVLRPHRYYISRCPSKESIAKATLVTLIIEQSIKKYSEHSMQDAEC